EYGLVRKGPELPEVLIRVPMFVVGPDIIENSLPHSAHVSLVDIVPTICEMIVVDPPKGVQGRSLLSLITGKEYLEKEFRSVYAEQGFGGEHYTEKDDIDFEHCGIPGAKKWSFDEINSYSQSGTMRMVRKNNWKLAYDMEGSGQLYDLDKDPLELLNLYGDIKY